MQAVQQELASYKSAISGVLGEQTDNYKDKLEQMKSSLTAATSMA